MSTNTTITRADGLQERAEHRVTVLDLPDTLRATKDDNKGFEGWAVRYGVKDTYGTTFEPGCFDAATPELTARRFPFLWMHDRYQVLGTFRVEEREEGLWLFDGRYDDTEAGRDAKQRALSGSAPALSVGFVQIIDPEVGDWERITMARLVETSQIVLGMQAVPGAELSAVRAAMTDDMVTRQPVSERPVPEDPQATRADLTAADESLLWRLRTA